MNQEEIYETENMDTYDNWEMEKHLLETKIKDLENALNKSKKFHQKFVDDVIESEELRIREFDRSKRELNTTNKQQLAEIRQLNKDKNFYEATCNELLNEKKQPEQPATFSERKSSATAGKAGNTKPSNGSRAKTTRSVSQFKISTKVFEDNKKLKDKISKLSMANANLRQQVKRLEKSNLKAKRVEEQHTADQQKMRNLLVSSTRTNKQIFNQLALSKLDESYGIMSNN